MRKHAMAQKPKDYTEYRRSWKKTEARRRHLYQYAELAQGNAQNGALVDIVCNFTLYVN